ncbi:MAG: rRNA maturation RNase YbeY [Thermomicrobiales bacterium]
MDVDFLVEDSITSTVSETDVEFLVRGILQREGARGHWVVSIVLTTNDRLRILHRDFLGIDEATDVMTFPVQSILGEQAIGGDIVVSAERAAEQAGEYGHTTEEEIKFLVVHGLLHLCGWTDETSTSRDAMLSRQDQLIVDFEATARD